MPSKYDFDLFVIGGGSGGVRASRLAAQAGARVAIAEEYGFGGTCVIRGCIPKKLFVYASHYREDFEDSAGFGWTVPPAHFDWNVLVANKNKEVARLEGMYAENVGKSGVEIIMDRAEFLDPHTVHLKKSGRKVTAERFLIATGGRPSRDTGGRPARSIASPPTKHSIWRNSPGASSSPAAATSRSSSRIFFMVSAPM